MKKFKCVIFLSVVIVVLTSGTKDVEPPKKLNVLFIIADDLNCALGAYGDPLVKTPHLDNLAQQGVLFENAHVQYPLCGPSRVSIMTGLYPDQTKSKELKLYVRQTIPDVVTLGEKFQMENYHAVRVGKIYHYQNPRHIGTSGHDDPYTWNRTINPYGRDKIDEHKIKGLIPNWHGGTLSWLEAAGRDEEQTDGIGATETIALLDEFAESGENFFLAYGLFRPHVPFVAPKAYFDLYDTDDFDVPESSDAYLKTIPEPAVISVRRKKEQINLDPGKAKYIKKAYYATTSFMDAQIGRVLDKLKETGLDKNTIVVFTSDHGYHLGEHGHWQKQTLFDAGTRVPLIIAGPGLNPERIKELPVELVDLYPTLMDLVKMDTPEFVRGQSLAPLLRTKEQPLRKSALTELNIPTSNGWAQGYSIKTNRYRLTQWKNKEVVEYELYDHYTNEGELKNLANDGSYKKVKDSLITVLSRRIAAAQKKPPGLGRQIENAQSWPEPPRILSQPK